MKAIFAIFEGIFGTFADQFLGKVFAKMGFRYLGKDIDDIVSSKPMAIEKALRILRVKIELYNEVKRND